MLRSYRYLLLSCCVVSSTIILLFQYGKLPTHQHIQISDKFRRFFENYVQLPEQKRNRKLPDWLDTTEGRSYSDYGDGTCGENPHKAKLAELLKRWIEIAKLHDVKYFLHGGSLLGAWRNGDVIPHDTDLDILVDVNDTLKLEKIQNIRNFTSQDGKYHLVLQQDWRLPYDKRRRVSCRGRQVDKMIDECSFEEPLGRLIKGWANYLDLYDYRLDKGLLLDPSAFWSGGGRYPVAGVFPLKRCRFLGLVTYCPHDPKVILHDLYGKGMKGLGPKSMCQNKSWVEVKYK